MSIIIQFNSPSYIQSAGAVPSNTPCLSKATVKLEMVPGIEHPDVPVMTDDEGSIIVSSSNSVFATALKEVKSSHYCFGLPYQDHNYGAPPPPTPPSYSPCPSPAADVAIADEDTNHSIISTTTTEEAQEESVTRCICGFEHDDEYMICCDHCLVWQHVDCMGLDRNNIPETYLCEKCEPRKLDRHKAKLLQARKKVVLTKLPTAKQEPSASNLIFGKNYKKKTLLQSSEQWHKTDYPVMSQVSQSQRFYCSTDSDEDSKNNERRPKTRSKRRKREEDRESSSKKNKTPVKHGRERMEIKRSRLRRNKNKESTSTADEEAQDAWAFSMEWCEENFEFAVNNQYTAEVQHLARMISLQGYEKKFYNQLHTKQCHVLDDGIRKQLVCLYDIPRNQPLIEYKGKYLLASQFRDLHPLYNKRLYPYVLFYTVDQTEICVDSSMYGNDARFVRRSCKPNAEIRHMSFNGNLHLYLQSTKVIFSEDEVTVPINFNQCESLKDIVCACGTEDCLVKPKKKNGSVEVCQEDKFMEKRRRTRRSTVSADDDSSQSVLTTAPVEKPPKMSPIKNITPIKSPEPVVPPLPPPDSNEQGFDMKGPSDHDSEEQSSDGKKKLTREERKIDAYVRAFNQMEKAQKRRQQALERQKAQQPKSEEQTEKPDSTQSPTPKEEEGPPPLPPVPVENTEKSPEEEVKVQPPVLRPKKWKRRRGSGTPSRRRTRTNSGGSDILFPSDETFLPANDQQSTTSSNSVTPTPTPEDNVTSTSIHSDPMIINILSAPTTPVIESPKIVKTKRLLLHEWLQEKSSEAIASVPVSSPCSSIHTEMTWNTSESSATMYVRCTKDTPHAGGIAAHLRRSNSSGHIRAAGSLGSAKKRWLRQAMNDCSDEPLGIDSSSMEHLDNACLSPSCLGDMDSPGTSTDDVVTPLKKRRLMRESVESLSSPHSPSVENCMDDTDATTSSSLINDTHPDQKTDTMDQQVLCVANENSVPLSPKKEEDSPCEINSLKLDFAEEETEVKDKIICDETVSAEVSSGNNCVKDESDTIENKICEADKSAMQNDCDFHPILGSDISGETIEETNPTLLQSDCMNPISSLNHDSFKTESCTNSEFHPHVTRTPEAVSSDSETGESSINSLNQSSVKVTDTENTENEDLLAQEQPSNSCTATTASSSVYTTSPIKLECTSLINHTTSPPVEVNIKAPDTAEYLPLKESRENETSDIKPSMQENVEYQSRSKEITSTLEVDIVDANTTTMQSVNKDDNITNDRPSNLSVNFEQTVCSAASSCSNVVDSSNIVSSSQSNNYAIEISKANGADDPNTCNHCTLNEDHSPVKPCSSATQKRKVSLSEYRMRMRENTSKSRSNSDPMIKGTDDSAMITPEKLPNVTLAPLPLFDTGDNLKNPANKQLDAKKKKDSLSKEDDNNHETEHRENLNERLKREFGFDVSEAPASLLQTKLKCNNQTSSNLSISNVPLCAQPPPPPPPPPPRPPRPLRSPQPVMSGVPAPQFGFVHPSFTRPPYIVSQVPGSYIAPQPSLATPILPSVHPMPPNPTTCNVRPPLLPSTHSFAPSMPGTILRTPPRHDYAPVNAQRFTAMVPQSQLTHKAYPHVYQSGLYK